MIQSIIMVPKSRFKRFYEDSTDYNKEKLNSHSNFCTNRIIETKQKKTVTLSAKFDAPKTAPKAYWEAANSFLNNTMVTAILL